MSKTLRKYQTWIMVVGGVLLMIAFLAPQAIQGLGQFSARRPAYTLSDGTSISGEEYAKQHKTMATLARVIPGVLAIYRIDPRDNAHWLLQNHLVKGVGLAGPKGDGADPAFIDQLAYEDVVGMLQARYGENWQLYMQFQREQVQQTMDYVKRQLSPAVEGAMVDGVRMDEMIADIRGLRRMREAYLAAPRPSPARVLASARSLMDGATIDAVLIPVDETKLASIASPSDAEIQAHYDKYREVKKGEGDYGFGFTLPSRVAIEWLKIDREAISAAVKLDPVEVQSRLLSTPESAGDAKARKAQVEDQLRREAAEKAVRAARDRVKNELLLAIGKLADRPATQFKIVPPGGIGVSLTDLGKTAAQQASDVLGVPVAPMVPQAMGLRTAEDLSGEAWLAGSALRMGASAIPAIDVLMSADGLPAGPTPLPVAVQTGVPLTSSFEDRAGNVYFVLVRDVRPPGPPLGLDEVKAQAVTELKKVAALKKLEELAPAMVAQAREVSVEDVQLSLKAKGERVGEVAKAARVSRQGVAAREPALNDELLREAVMSRAQKLDPTVPLDPRDPELTFAVTLPKAFGVAIVHIATYDPLTEERFRALVPQARNQLLFKELSGAALDEPFTLPSLARRFGVDLKSKSEE